MGEKFTLIVHGCWMDAAPPCPHIDGWGEWAWTSPIFTRTDFDAVFSARNFRKSYESDRAWIGFEIDVLSYGDTRMFYDLPMIAARDAWERLRVEVKKIHGLELPEGRVIVAHDQ